MFITFPKAEKNSPSVGWSYAYPTAIKVESIVSVTSEPSFKIIRTIDHQQFRVMTFKENLEALEKLDEFLKREIEKI